MARPPKKEGPRTNEDIEAKQVRLVDHEGTNHGVVDIQRALEVATAAGLDLVEIAGTSEPPVCKVMDYGKFRFEAQKKAALARKKQKTQEVKEIKMRPNIDTHDFDVKKKAMTRFIEDGDKVKVTIRFRGREMAHQELGMAVLTRVKEEMSDIIKVESQPKTEGRQVMMVIVPK